MRGGIRNGKTGVKWEKLARRRRLGMGETMQGINRRINENEQWNTTCKEMTLGARRKEGDIDFLFSSILLHISIKMHNWQSHINFA